VQGLDSREGLRRAQSLAVAQDLVWVSAPGLGLAVVGFSEKPPISVSSSLLGRNLRNGGLLFWQPPALSKRDYPEHLQAKFEGRRFIDMDPPRIPRLWRR
jgi:hypothetical protein